MPSDCPDHTAREADLAGIYRLQLPFVRRLLARFGIPRELIDDAAQDVFVVIHRRWEDWDVDVPIRCVLYGVSRRVAADYRRRARRSPLSLEVGLIASGGLSVDAEFERERARRALQRAVGHLDERKRTVLMLADVEGHTGPEIATELGLAVPTVYSRLRAARAQVVETARSLAATA